MAEARAEEEEENLRRETREQVVRRQSGGRPDRRKPEHRHSQGPLSSIRAAIKRTSTRPASVSDTARDRDRDRERERRRPEITILSAEPLASTSWFPSAPGGFPPPPPPAAQIWGATIPPAVQPPPSYEEVIREKTQEVVPSSSPPPSSSSTITIATQTDAGSAAAPPEPPAQRPVRPPRPPPASPAGPPPVGDVTPDQPPPPPSVSASTPCCDLLGDLCSPSASQTDGSDRPSPDPAQPERPRPRPRTKLAARPAAAAAEVRVQTLVKLREDGAATLAAAHAARTGSEAPQGGYLRELLEAFGGDDWGFPDRHGDGSELSQSESEEEEEEEDMATLRARIQAFEQQAADGGGRETPPTPPAKPEPRPRPRLQGQPARSPLPPAVAPKPKNLPSAARPSGGKPPLTPKPRLAPDTPVPAPRPPPPKLTAPGADSAPDSASNPKPPPRPSAAPRAGVSASRQDGSAADGPPTATPPSTATVTLTPPPTVTPPLTATATPPPTVTLTPTPPPTATMTVTPPPTMTVTMTPPPTATVTPPPRPPAEVCAAAAARTGSEESQAVKGSVRPDVPTRPPALIAPTPVSRSPDLDTAAPARTSSVKLLPLRPPPIKANPGRPPPPAFSSAPSAAPSRPGDAPPPPRPAPSPVTANQRAARRGPPLPPRPRPGHPLYCSTKQEVLIVLDDLSPAPSERRPLDGGRQTAVVKPLDPEPAVDRDGRSKEDLGPSESQSILPVAKEQPDPPPLSGPRCVATFDYDGEEEDELTFCQGDVIALLAVVDGNWGRGQIHGRVGVFPLNFTQVVEETEETGGTQETEALRRDGDDLTGQSLQSTAAPTPPPASEVVAEEWATALFDFPGQTAEDLCFQQGALIQVTEHLDGGWRRGLLGGREGLYPAAFTQPYCAQPIRGQQAAASGSAKAVFDFTAENDDELNLKVGDVITQVELVDEQWIVGVVGGRRGIVPKNYVSLA